MHLCSLYTQYIVKYFTNINTQTRTCSEITILCHAALISLRLEEIIILYVTFILKPAVGRFGQGYGGSCLTSAVSWTHSNIATTIEARPSTKITSLIHSAVCTTRVRIQQNVKILHLGYLGNFTTLYYATVDTTRPQRKRTTKKQVEKRSGEGDVDSGLQV